MLLRCYITERETHPLNSEPQNNHSQLESLWQLAELPLLSLQSVFMLSGGYMKFTKWIYKINIKPIVANNSCNIFSSDRCAQEKQDVDLEAGTPK